MTAPNNKPVPDDILARFAAYLLEHPAWGSLHIVLDDDNVEDRSVTFCQEYARQKGDAEGEFLAGVLLGLSASQRLSLPSRVDRFIDQHLL